MPLLELTIWKKKMIEFSIRKPKLIFSLFFITILLGLLCFDKLQVRLWPEVPAVYYYVNTLYKGASTEEVERDVTKELIKSFKGIKNLKDFYGTSSDNFSTVYLDFELKSDKNEAERNIRSAIDKAFEKMPSGVEKPTVEFFDISNQYVLSYSVSNEKYTNTQLTNIIEDDIKVKLFETGLVSKIDTFGGYKNETKIKIDKNKLIEYDLSLVSIVNSLKNSGVDVPLGTLDSKKDGFYLNMNSAFNSLPLIEDHVVRFYGNEMPTKISDVGFVSLKETNEDKAYLFNGKKAIRIDVFKKEKTTDEKFSNLIEKEIKKISKEYNNDIEFKIAHDNSKFIVNEIHEVKDSILIGIVLTVIIVYLFLGNARSTFITALALPNSIIGAFALMYLAGFTINIMTLIALSLAVGLLIDDAIVVRENIFKYIEEGYSPFEASLKGTKEVSKAVIATTLAIIAVFGPAAFMAGLAGSFFKEFGLSICFAMLISLLDSLTIAPMLSNILGKTEAAHLHDKNIVKKVILYPFKLIENIVTRLYISSFNFSTKVPLLVIFASILILFSSLFVATKIPFTFLKPYDFDNFKLIVELDVNNSREHVVNIARKMSEDLKNLKYIKSVSCIIGNKEEYHKINCIVNLVPKGNRLIKTQDAKIKVNQFLKGKYSDLTIYTKNPDIFNRETRGLEVQLMSEDKDKLAKFSNIFVQKISENNLLDGISSTKFGGKNSYSINIDDDKLNYFGLNKFLVASEIRTAIYGSKVGNYLTEDGKKVDLVLELDKTDLLGPQDIIDSIQSPNINYRNINLSQFAYLSEKKTDYQIKSKNGYYVSYIGGDVPENSLGLNAQNKKIKELFNQQPEKDGITFSTGGNARDFEDLKVNFVLVIVFSFFLLYFVLTTLYDSFLTPLIIISAIPMSASGVFFSLKIAGDQIDIYALMAALLLMGVSTKNSIILVDFIEDKIKGGMGYLEAIKKSGEDRFRPIVMTSLALIMGALPLAIGISEGAATKSSMGIATIGGVISSTILTLYVVPAIYIIIYRTKGFFSKNTKKVNLENRIKDDSSPVEDLLNTLDK